MSKVYPEYIQEILLDIQELGRVRRNNVPLWKELLHDGLVSISRFDGVQCLELTPLGESILQKDPEYVYSYVWMNSPNGYEIVHGRRANTSLAPEHIRHSLLDMLKLEEEGISRYGMSEGWPSSDVLIIRYTKTENKNSYGAQILHFDRIEGTIQGVRCKTAEEMLAHFTEWPR